MAAHTGPSASNDFRYNALLLSGNGINGAQNNTFMDSTAPGGYAVNFKGSPDGIYYDYGSTTHSYWNNDFTIEFWVNTTQSTGVRAIFESWYDNGFGAGSYGLAISNGAVALSNRQSSGTNMSSFITSGSTLVSDGAWHHVAITQTTGASKTFRLFVDGVMRGYKVETNWTQGLSSTYIYIGEQGPGTYDETNRFFTGLVSNLRLVTSVVSAYVTSSTTVGTTVFTPPNAPLSAIANTSVLLCQSPTLVDNGPSAKTISVHGTASVTTGIILTRTGNVAQGTFSPFSLAEGQWSNYFDGVDDFLSYPSTSTLNFGTDDFTIECWINLGNTLNSKVLISGTSTNSFGFRYGRSYNVNGGLSIYRAGQADLESCTFSFDVNTWYHVAVVRQSNVIRFFVNGVQQTTSGSGGASYNYPTETNVRIGTGDSGAEDYMGYLSNLRVVKGTAVYTSNFTPSTSSLTAVSGTSLLTCQSNRFKDNSSNNFTITPAGDTKVTAFSPFEPGAPYISSINGGSAYFDGSGDYLLLPASSNYNFGSSDFTIEFWYYKNGAQETYARYFQTHTGDVYTGISISQNSSTQNQILVSLSSNGSSWDIVSGLAGTINDYAWNHCALVRSGTNFTFYVNGTPTALATSSSSLYYNAAHTPVIGGQSGTSRSLNGFVSNFRIIKGTALYTSAFTPPTTLLTPITNTSLLLNCTNAGIIDNAGKNNIETVGNAQVSTSVKKYGTGSMYFDGAGDYLELPPNDVFDLGYGAFTIESWIYLTASGTTSAGETYWPIVNKHSIYNTNTTTGNNTAWEFRYSPQTGNKLVFTNRIQAGNFVEGTNLFSKLSTAVNLSLNTWYHVAAVRSGTTLKLFLNGVDVTDNSSGNYDWSTINMSLDTGQIGLNKVRVGRMLGGSNPGTAVWYAIGYIDDLRITKGLARYTSNFNPPSYPLKLR